MATEARFQGVCSVCQMSYPAGESIVRTATSKAWIHAACAAAAPAAVEPQAARAGKPDAFLGRVRPALYRGSCATCGKDVAAGAWIALTDPPQGWSHGACADQETRALWKQVEEGGTTKGLDALLCLVQQVWPDSSSLVADVRITGRNTDNEFVHARPVVVRAAGADVDNSTFSRKAYTLCQAAAVLLANLAIEGYDGERFPDEVEWPGD